MRNRQLSRLLSATSTGIMISTRAVAAREAKAVVVIEVIEETGGSISPVTTDRETTETTKEVTSTSSVRAEGRSTTLTKVARVTTRRRTRDNKPLISSNNLHRSRLSR